MSLQPRSSTVRMQPEQPGLEPKTYDGGGGPAVPSIGAEAVRVADALSSTSARLIGGVAVWYVCPSARREHFARQYEDIDVAVEAKDRGELKRVVGQLGFQPNAQFNALQGARRQLYWKGDLKLDVFVDRFEMCLNLDLRGRLALVDRVLNPTDLLLTKLQIVQLTWKDVQDAMALLADCELGESDWASEINLGRIAAICARDWGWWATLTDNIDRLLGHVPSFGPDAVRLQAQLGRLREATHERPRSLAWRMRDKVGRRKAWYRLPDEIEG